MTNQCQYRSRQKDTQNQSKSGPRALKGRKPCNEAPSLHGWGFEASGAATKHKVGLKIVCRWSHTPMGGPSWAVGPANSYKQMDQTGNQLQIHLIISRMQNFSNSKYESEANLLLIRASFDFGICSHATHRRTGRVTTQGCCNRRSVPCFLFCLSVGVVYASATLFFGASRTRRA